MKILHIEAGKHLYGGAKQVVYLLNGLVEKGHDCVLLCHHASAIRNAFNGIPEVQVVPLSLGGDLDVSCFFKIASQIRLHKPDLVHVHSRRGADVWGGLAAKWTGVPAICSRRVDNAENAHVSRWKYGLFKKVIAISEGIRRVLLAQSVDADKVVTVHSAVDTSEYQPLPQRSWLLETYQLPQDALVVASFAQMIERKGQQRIIESAARLRKSFPQLRFLIFGQGPMLERYKTLSSEHGVADIVHFPGFTNDVGKVLPSIDVLAHPASKEGLGVILLQAGACAVPAIAGNAGGMPEVIINRLNGFIIEPDDMDQLTEDLARLLGSESLRRKMGEAGRERICKEFSISAMVEGNISVYEQILQRK